MLVTPHLSLRLPWLAAEEKKSATYFYKGLTKICKGIEKVNTTPPALLQEPTEPVNGPVTVYVSPYTYLSTAVGHFDKSLSLQNASLSLKPLETLSHESAITIIYYVILKKLSFQIFENQKDVDLNDRHSLNNAIIFLKKKYNEKDPLVKKCEAMRDSLNLAPPPPPIAKTSPLPQQEFKSEETEIKDGPSRIQIQGQPGTQPEAQLTDGGL